MSRKQWIMAVCALALVGGAALLLGRFKAGQRLGEPGVKTHPIPGRINRVVDLPEKVLNYESQWREANPVATNALPPDTSFGQRVYTAPDGFQVVLNVVLMGTDRTSMHKPQFCLTGAGWHIDQTERTTVAMDQPIPYSLPVTKLTLTWLGQKQAAPQRGLSVYWYVTDKALSGDATGFQRMWLMTRDLVKTGVLERWAYVLCLVGCEPGQEERAYERLKEFLTAAVPEFQLTPAAGPASSIAHE